MARERNAELEKLYRAQEDLLFRIALTRMQQREIEELLAQTEESEAENAAQMRRVARVIERGVRRRSARKFVRHTLPRAGQIVSGVLLVCVLGLTTAMATSAFVRVQVMRFIVRVMPEYTELSLAPDPSASFDVPADWQGLYYPSYIPEGFALGEVDTDFCTVYYFAERDVFISFTENNENAQVNIDTEDAALEYVSIGAATALVSEKEGHVFVTWATSDRFFVLRAWGVSTEEAVAIARSVTRIR